MSILAYAILGLLAAQPLSGYDLSRKMKISVGLFWQASHSQIYPELAQLQAKGMVTFQRIEQQDRPDKKVYNITETGLKALQAWIIQPSQLSPMRDEFILKTFNLWVVERPEALEMFRQEETRHRQQQAEYEKILKEGAERLTPEQKTKQAASFGSYLTLNWAIQYEAAYADWCHWVVQELEKPE